MKLILFILIGTLIASGITLRIYLWLESLRSIVLYPFVHIVHRRGKSIAHFPSSWEKRNENYYYDFPYGLPFLGVLVAKLQSKPIVIKLRDFNIIDKNSSKWKANIEAVFIIKDFTKAGKRASSQECLKIQLENIFLDFFPKIISEEVLEKDNRNNFFEYPENFIKKINDFGIIPQNFSLTNIRLG